MIEFRSLRPHEIDAWLDQITLVFNRDFPNPGLRPMFENAWNYDPDKDLLGVRVAVEGDKILSSLQVVRRRIYLRGQEVAMGGIAAVSTLPEARRQGLSTRLLQDSIRLMEQWDQPVSMLQTGIQGFYRRLGWEQLSFFSKHLRLDGRVAEAPAGCTLRRLDFAADLEQVSRIHALVSSRYNGPVVRSLDGWKKFTLHPPDRWWVAEGSGQVVAYLCINVENAWVGVAEFGALPGSEALFDPLLSHGLEALKRPLESMACPAVIASQREVARWEEHTHWMARLNRPFEIAGQRVETTQELIDLMSGSPAPGSQGIFTFWGNDWF